MSAAKPWDRRLWGIEFEPSLKGDKPLLLGSAWFKPTKDQYCSFYGEPTRALLFCTRDQARNWCRGKNAEWKKAGLNWHVSAVRVRELVEKVKA